MLELFDSYLGRMIGYSLVIIGVGIFAIIGLITVIKWIF